MAIKSDKLYIDENGNFYVFFQETHLIPVVFTPEGAKLATLSGVAATKELAEALLKEMPQEVHDLIVLLYS